MKTLSQKQQLVNCKALLARMEGRLAEWRKKEVEENKDIADFASKLGDAGYTLEVLQTKIGYRNRSEARTYQLRLDIEALKAALGGEVS